MAGQSRAFRKIIQAKAEFIGYMGIAIHSRMERIRELRVEAARISESRKADRERAANLRGSARALEEELALELGYKVMSTYRFVVDNGDQFLTKKLRELFYHGRT